MFGRLRYYSEKAATHLKQHGPIAMIRETFSFLIRRKFFFQFFFESFEYHLLSRLRDIDSTVIQVFKNDPVTSPAVLLYASYDAKSEIGEHVLFQLNAFKAEGYDIVFVTTAPTLPYFEFNKIKDLVTICVHRKNTGYDFISWKVGQKLVLNQIGDLNSLILMNDSCLGPLFDLSDIIKKMRNASDSVYGISESEEIHSHIQSYFYHFGSNLIRSEVVQAFFNRVRLLKTKWGIVRYLEIGSSKFFMQEKIKFEALVDARDENVKRLMNEFNQTEPTRDPLARKWIEMRLSPFYKRSNLA